MATPVIDLRLRLRNAGVPEEQADAIAGAFESLSNQISELNRQIRNVIVGQRIQLRLLLLVAAAFLAVYRGLGRHHRLGDRHHRQLDSVTTRMSEAFATRRVEVGPITIGNDLPFVLIAGPCQIRSGACGNRDRGALVEIAAARELGLIYKLVRQSQPDQRREPARPRPR